MATKARAQYHQTLSCLSIAPFVERHTIAIEWLINNDIEQAERTKIDRPESWDDDNSEANRAYAIEVALITPLHSNTYTYSILEEKIRNLFYIVSSTHSPNALRTRSIKPRAIAFRLMCPRCHTSITNQYRLLYQYCFDLSKAIHTQKSYLSGEGSASLSSVVSTMTSSSAASVAAIRSCSLRLCVVESTRRKPPSPTRFVPPAHTLRFSKFYNETDRFFFKKKLPGCLVVTRTILMPITKLSSLLIWI